MGGDLSHVAIFLLGIRCTLPHCLSALDATESPEIVVSCWLEELHTLRLIQRPPSCLELQTLTQWEIN